MTRGDPILRLLDWWRAGDTVPLPPATESEIATFEKKYSVKIPADLRRYFLLANGTGNLQMDQELYAFWSISELKTPLEQFNDEKDAIKRPHLSSYFVFMDWSINAAIFAIQLHAADTIENHIVNVGATSEKLLATSFTEFVEKYLANPNFGL